jgi:hypothetical protein
MCKWWWLAGIAPAGMAGMDASASHRTNARWPSTGASMKPAGTNPRRSTSPRTSKDVQPGFLMWRIPFIVLLIPERLAKPFEALAPFCHF